jgi:hypothetical protein
MFLLNIKKVVSVGILSVSLVFVGSAAASAAASANPVTPSPVNPGQVASNSAVVAQLKALVGKQSRSEITRIAHSTAPAELLVNPNTGETLAAIQTRATIQPLSTSWTSPGCAPGDACVYANGGTTHLGFTGYGSTLAFTMNNVTKWETGNRYGSLANAAKTFAATPFKTVNFSPGGYFTAIGRA